MARGPKPFNYFGLHRGTGDESVGEVAEFLVGGIGTGAFPRQLHIAQAGDAGTDWGIADQAHPLLSIHSVTTPITDHLDLQHDGTQASIAAVGGTLDLTAVGSLIINDASADVDFRVEGLNNANMIVMDAGQDALSFGGANVDGAGLTINNLTTRTAVTKVGNQLHFPAQTSLFDNTSGTIAIAGVVSIGINTYDQSPASACDLTLTDAASLYIEGAPLGTGSAVVVTNPYSIFVDAGETRLDGRLSVRSGRISELLTAVDDDSQCMTLAAADILAGINVHTSTSAGGTVTVDTAANIISGIPLDHDGQTVVSYYINDGDQTVTFAVACGTAIADTGSTILINEAAVLVWRRTSSSAVTLYIMH